MTTARTLLLLLLLAPLAACGDVAPPAAPGAAPDDDVRWVGAGGVVVAVPRWWSTGETQCLKPVETTVYADAGGVTDCADEPSEQTLAEVSSLAVMDTTYGNAAALVERMRPAGRVGGRQVLELEGCDPWFTWACRRVVAVPSAGIAFGVVIADRADGSWRAVRDSLRALPDGTTTVPIATPDGGHTPAWGDSPAYVETYRSALEAAGLSIEVAVAPLPDPDETVTGMVADLPHGSLLRVDPEPGTPIEQGGTVTLVVMGRR